MSEITEASASGDWIDFRRDAETGIESINAHFRGHAYDSHDPANPISGSFAGGDQSGTHRQDPPL